MTWIISIIIVREAAWKNRKKVLVFYIKTKLSILACFMLDVVLSKDTGILIHKC